MPGITDTSENTAKFWPCVRSRADLTAVDEYISEGSMLISIYIMMIPQVERAEPILLTKPCIAEPRPLSL